MTSSTPFITVALCTHNHADRLARTLETLAHLHSPRQSWEMLVIDNGSTDATPTLLARSEWRPEGVEVRIVREDRLGLSNARNRALREARGEYLLYMDDDETPDPEWLLAHERAMIEHQPDALGGRIEVMFEDGDRPAWLQDELLGFLGKLDNGEARWLTTDETPIFGGNFAFLGGTTGGGSAVGGSLLSIGRDSETVAAIAAGVNIDATGVAVTATTSTRCSSLPRPPANPPARSGSTASFRSPVCTTVRSLRSATRRSSRPRQLP